MSNSKEDVKPDDSQKAPEAAQSKPTKAVKTVRMTRIEPWEGEGPRGADVHPDEVENWKALGWEVAK